MMMYTSHDELHALPDHDIAAVRLMSRADLRHKLARRDDFVFVMAMDQLRYDTAHIEGSISYDQLLEQLPMLPHDAEIVMYCTTQECVASKLRAAALVEQGFTNVSRYAGGLADWAGAGLPIVTSTTSL